MDFTHSPKVADLQAPLSRFMPMQAHGAAGVCDDYLLPFFYAQARTLQFADGPDEVHRNQVARNELACVAAAELVRASREARCSPVRSVA